MILRRKDLVVRPLDDPDLQVQPASIDLRLGREFLTFRSARLPLIDPADPRGLQDYTERVALREGEPFILHPGEFALGSTLEWVELPHDLVARVEGRSSLGRLAIVVHATAGFIDPGFQGTITLELSNLGRVPVALRPGMRVCQIAVYQLSSPSERPYGPARGSKYQGQRGPTPSKVHEDLPSSGP
ncbi:MAG: dCTP deaminase [Halobacteriales archaeon]|nr:dCTP deaminase [Halobacteriales archaeon]